ncbi:hypothetical protein SZ55_1274 [Pseudomonas sp. FeS53a]|nr:hypothetical protein SZ55_1274 [Pseudomonas sp. FeS53a]
MCCGRGRSGVFHGGALTSCRCARTVVLFVSMFPDGCIHKIQHPVCDLRPASRRFGVGARETCVPERIR